MKRLILVDTKAEVDIKAAVDVNSGVVFCPSFSIANDCTAVTVLSVLHVLCKVTHSRQLPMLV